MKRNTAVFIDGENVPAREYEMILNVARNAGIVDEAKVYGLSKDMRTVRWTKEAEKSSELKDVRLKGRPRKNKVDERIKRDMLKTTRERKNVDIFVLASSDHGYATAIHDLRACGKRVVVIGREGHISGKLVEAANECYVY